MEFRTIDILGFAPVVSPAELGAVPDQRWLPIDRLVVDPGYQRPIQGNGRTNVRRIAETFSWLKFSPVVCSPIPGGRYAIIDGQHRTTAAALLGITEVPCQIVVAGAREQAEAFGAINSQVSKLTAVQLHTAAVHAGDPAAIAVRDVCAAAGVEIVGTDVLARLRQKEGDTRSKTSSARTIGKALGRYETMTVVLALKAIVAGTADGSLLYQRVIQAVTAVLHDHPDYRRSEPKLIHAFEEIDLADLVQAARLEAVRRRGVDVGTLLEAQLLDALEKKRLG